MTVFIPKDDNLVPAPRRGRVALGRRLSTAAVAAIALATLLPASTRAAPEVSCIICGSAGGADAVLNVLLFLPLGIGLALARLPGRRAIVAMCFFTIAIESLQLIIPGRDASFGDVIANSVGGALGFVTGGHVEEIMRPGATLSRWLAIAWSVIWLVVQVVTAYGFVPSVPVSPYYGQIARDFGAGAPRFDGIVLGPMVGTEPIPDAPVAEPARFRTSLTRRAGAVFQAQVIPRSCSRGIAPIVRVAASGDVEILNASQLGRDFVYGIRTGAEVLRLQRVRFRLPDALASSCDASVATDTISLQARYALSAVVLRATTRNSAVQEVNVPGLSAGWRLVMPGQTYVEGGLLAAIAGWVWMAVLIAPGAYWARSTNDAKRAMGPAAVASLLFGGALAIGGLIGVPLFFGLPPTPWPDCLATLLGAAFGVLVAQVTG